MSYSHKQCEALKYGNCQGYTQDVDVVYKYRYKRGGIKPDENIKISLCKIHTRWLKEYNQGNPLEMRGETAEEAREEDLFMPFADKERMYMLIRVELLIEDTRTYDFYLIRGGDIDNFRQLLCAGDKHDQIMYINSVGFFQTSIIIIKDGGDFKQFVIEVNSIDGELPLEALANGLTTFYKPASNGEMHNISASAVAWIPRVEENPTLDSEYTLEPLPEFIRTHFKEKQHLERMEYFEECCGFIDGEISENIINWEKTRENSPYATMRDLFDAVALFTRALYSNKLEGDYVITNLLNGGKLSEDVLWVTYVMANHELYSTHDPKKCLRESSKLIDIFILFGLDKDLLALAISGERLRMLSLRQRDSHDILQENSFVVEYLVPKYINGVDVIYKSAEAIILTPLEYWHYYDNTTCYFGGGFGYGRDNTEYFEKNETIRLHLEKHTPADIIDKINTPVVDANIIGESPIEDDAESPLKDDAESPIEDDLESPVNIVSEPEFGALDISLLPKESLDFYKKIVIENGHPASEFIILGFPGLFETLYTSVVDGKQKTMAYTENLFPGITEMYEQKKRDLRKNDYKAWQFVNDKLRKNM